MGNQGEQNQERPSGDRRPVSQSYREKLLSPGGLGFLVSHGEADDIVSGWKGFFAKQQAKSEAGNGGEEGVATDDDMGDTQSNIYPVLLVTSEQYTSWCKPLMNSLIIKVLGLSVPKHVLIDRGRRMWKPKQPLKVVPLSNKYYIVSFSSKEDRDYAYYEGPGMIHDHYLLVQRWTPNFNPRKADGQKKVAVWVRIPDLPLEFCTVESLGMVGNMIGRIIKIDRSTSIYDKGAMCSAMRRSRVPIRKQGQESRRRMWRWGIMVANSKEPVGLEAGRKSNLMGTTEEMTKGQKDQQSPTEKPVTILQRVVLSNNNHLGLQMILSRDWRRGMHGAVGIKDQEISPCEVPISHTLSLDHVESSSAVGVLPSQDFNTSQGTETEAIVEDVDMEGNHVGSTNVSLVKTNVDNILGHGLGSAHATVSQ
ncbi:hypothetical protein K1719_020061 [Acacia pycnantha]|nr:hypothetical protein K1719_020061 [Acacia pycnantha]